MNTLRRKNFLLFDPFNRSDFRVSAFPVLHGPLVLMTNPSSLPFSKLVRSGWRAIALDSRCRPGRSWYLRSSRDYPCVFHFGYSPKSPASRAMSSRHSHHCSERLHLFVPELKIPDSRVSRTLFRAETVVRMVIMSFFIINTIIL